MTDISPEAREAAERATVIAHRIAKELSCEEDLAFIFEQVNRALDAQTEDIKEMGRQLDSARNAIANNLRDHAAKDEELARLRELDRINGEAVNGYRSEIVELKASILRARAENERLKDALNWQNVKNKNPAPFGAFEFYINEEWTGIARVALDSEDATSIATLAKRRYDPDDERVRVRRVNADDALITENDSLRAENERLKEEATRWYHADGSYTTHTAEEVVQMRKDAAARIATLEQQAMEMEKDKARIDFLETHGDSLNYTQAYKDSPGDDDGWQVGASKPTSITVDVFGKGETLRQAIDAATAATNEGGSEG